MSQLPHVDPDPYHSPEVCEKPSIDCQYQVGQRVWLTTQDFPLQHLSLSGPFPVQKVAVASRSPAQATSFHEGSPGRVPWSLTFHLHHHLRRLLDGDPICRHCGQGLQYFWSSGRGTVPRRGRGFLPDSSLTPQLIAVFHGQHHQPTKASASPKDSQHGVGLIKVHPQTISKRSLEICNKQVVVKL